MAEFLKDSQLTAAIEELIDNANDCIWLISPYIKLHERIKDRLRIRKQIPDLHIVVVFGKNEEDASKSLSKEDFEFLKDFPRITIGYEKRLHAKYYASENCSIITSMNLHEFSQNNNIEAGIRLKSKNWLSTSSDTSDKDAFNYFTEVVDNCTIIFDKEPRFKSTGILKLTETYSHSEVITDESDNFFKKKEVTGKKYFQRQPKQAQKESPEPTQGFCIRTGKQIPFNLKRPMCFEAYQSWNQYKKEDYPEKFCHRTGKPSNGKTSMRNPVLFD